MSLYTRLQGYVYRALGPLATAPDAGSEPATFVSPAELQSALFSSIGLTIREYFIVLKCILEPSSSLK